MRSKLILEKPGHLFKWPQFMTWLLGGSPEEITDEAITPKKFNRERDKPDGVLNCRGNQRAKIIAVQFIGR